MTSSHTVRLATAIKVAQKRIKVLGTKALNSNLDHFCGDFAEAYRCGVEEAQQEIVTRLRELANRPDETSRT